MGPGGIVRTYPVRPDTHMFHMTGGAEKIGRSNVELRRYVLEVRGTHRPWTEVAENDVPAVNANIAKYL